MPTTLRVGPVTRIEGHLDIEVTVDLVNGRQQVVAAKSSGTMFRGFELILKGRNPLDAPHLTQRICGVCPTSHGMASSLVLEAAMKITPTANGRILRNLVLGADFLQSHILHFYHLAALDYVNTTGLLEKSPWVPRYVTPDMIGGSVAANLVNHYVQALDIRRKAHRMGAIFGGRMPCSSSFVPGGCTTTVTSTQVSDFKSLLTEITAFINNVYLPDARALEQAFISYRDVGKGCSNLLAYGVFDQDTAGTQKLLKRGRYTNGANTATLAPTSITEDVKYSYYSSASGLTPASGATTPLVDKTGAYSWIKAPRYERTVHEVGPLARMWVNGDYRRGISAMDRIMARALETQKIAQAMATWVGQLTVGGATQATRTIAATGTGIGWTEAPRGAVGHWVRITNSLIDQYQVLSPTGWNASPRDDLGQPGAIEQALIGTPVADLNQPVELLRVVHSFDPCLACSVHLARPGERARKVVVTA